MAKKQIGVSFAPENYEFVSAMQGDSFTEKMNAFLDDVRAGLWKKGKDLNAPDGTLDHYLVTYTSEDLDKILKVKKIQLADLNCELKRKQLNPTYTKPEIEDSLKQPAATQLAAKNYFMCKNGCGCTLYWQFSKNKSKWIAAEKDTDIMHMCPNYQPKNNAKAHAVESEVKDNSGKRVTCSTCGESFSTYFNDVESLDRLLDTLMGHTQMRHNRGILTTEETQQMRLLKGGVTT